MENLYMPVLKSLSFTALPKTGNDPVQLRRAKFVPKLEEHKLLLKDPTTSGPSSGGSRSTARGRPPLSSGPSGPGGRSIPRVRLSSIKFGAKLIEFEKGKAGIVVQSKDKLAGVIDALISAVRAGELGELFSQAARPVRSARRARRPDYANRVAGPTRHPSSWPICRRLRRQCFSEPHESAHAARPSAP